MRNKYGNKLFRPFFVLLGCASRFYLPSESKAFGSERKEEGRSPKFLFVLLGYPFLIHLTRRIPAFLGSEPEKGAPTRAPAPL